MKFNIDLVDKKAQEEGTWIEYPMLEYCAFKVRRRTNKVSTDFQKKIAKSKAVRIQSEKMMEALLVEHFAKDIIVDWKGIEDDKGNVIEYSTEQCIALLTCVPDVLDWIVVSANDMTKFLTVEQEDEGHLDMEIEDIKK